MKKIQKSKISWHCPFNAGQEEEEDEEDETRKILDVGELSAEEARYLLHKLLAMTVNQTCLATQKEGRIRHARAIRENCLKNFRNMQILPQVNFSFNYFRNLEILPQNNVRNLEKMPLTKFRNVEKNASQQFPKHIRRFEQSRNLSRMQRDKIIVGY